MVHIGGDARSGGSLLCRLFDGHPNVGAYPFECEYFEGRNDRLFAFQDFIEKRDESLLRDTAFINKFFNYSNGKLQSKLFYDDEIASFRFDTFFESVLARLQSAENLCDAVVFEVVAVEFFKQFYGRSGGDVRLTHIVNHCSRTFAAPLDAFFSVFPKGLFVQTIRDPLAVCASLKNYSYLTHGRRLSGMPLRLAELSATRWLLALHYATANKLRHGDRYILLRYEDLVRRCEPTLRRLCAVSGLDYREEMTVPRIGEVAWSGNSSFGALPRAVSTLPLEKFKDALTAGEIGVVGRLASKAMEALEESWRDGIMDATAAARLSPTVTSELDRALPGFDGDDKGAKAAFDALDRELWELIAARRDDGHPPFQAAEGTA